LIGGAKVPKKTKEIVWGFWNGGKTGEINGDRPKKKTEGGGQETWGGRGKLYVSVG